VIDAIIYSGASFRHGEGDHEHILGTETAYDFVSLRQLLADFRRDVETYCEVTL
jgi:hypothetical protein